LRGRDPRGRRRGATCGGCPMNRRWSAPLPLVSFSFTLVLLLTTSLEAYAGSVHWTNAAGGNWNVAGNWNSGAGPVPGASDTAFIDLAGTYTVTLNVDLTVAAIQVGASSGVQTLNGSAHTITTTTATTIGPSGVLVLSSAAVVNGPLSNQGTMTCNQS